MAPARKPSLARLVTSLSVILLLTFSAGVRPGYSYQVAPRMISLVNQERARYGLSPLKENPALSSVATIKAQDMRDNGYFDHWSPTYGDNQNLIRYYGIGGSVAENIAAGQTNYWSAFNTWINSPGHRDNILNSDYYETGVGYAEGGEWGYYWVQMFILR